MGVGGSKEEEARLASAVQKLSKVELKYIENVFGELSYTSDDGKRLIKRPTWLNRDNFASKFGLPDFLGEQLFAAFDRDQNEVVDLDEFLIGMALCLHGSVKDKCQLLFKVFNLNGDEGIAKEELSTVLISALQSTRGLLQKITHEGEETGTVGWEMTINNVVEKLVHDAFEKCDTSKNGKLEIHEFENWIHKNPKLINSMFLISCPRPGENPADYTVITTPVEKEPAFDLSATNVKSVGAATNLSDLFDNSVVTSKDQSGESFFDSFGKTIPSSRSLDPIPSTTVATEQEIDRPKTVEDLTILELPKDIITHHQILLNNENISARGSEMSLVSLGQSTGDLSSMDNEASVAADTEASVEISSESEKPEDDSQEQTKTCIPAKNVVGPAKHEGDTTASWHPLQDALRSPLPQELSDDDDDALFQDAPGTSDLTTGSEIENKVKIEIDPDSQTDSSSQYEVDNKEVEIALSSDLVSDPSITPSVTESRIPESQTGLISSEPGFAVGDLSVADTSTTPNLEPVLETLSDSDVGNSSKMSDGHDSLKENAAETSVKRPDTLDVHDTENLASIELSSVEHAIGKPTLRQLAEMKEFDKSPSLEDGKNLLPEARFAAWQPSSETQHLIEALKRGNTVEKTRLTYPSVLLETSLGDPVRDMVAKFLGEQDAAKRPVPTADTVTMNDAGLRDLLNAKCWRGAIDWTAKYLTAHGQGASTGSPTGPFNHTPKLLQIWFVRIALLFKLKLFSSAEAELNAFGDFDNPDLFYEYYTELYPGMKGSLVPFSLRVLHAELPQHNGRPQETLDRSYRLLANVKSSLENLENHLTENGEKMGFCEEDRLGAIKLWKSRKMRILFSIGNCLLGIKEYNLALQIFSQIIQENPDTKSAIISGIGRLHLQLGDINLAKRYFKRVEHLSSGDAKTLSVTVMNRGFVALAEGSYQEAFENFQSVMKLDPENSAAWNNAAVCLLFQGKVKEASNLLETLVWKSPKHNLHEDIVFNLCTIYELETSRAFQKKQKLLHLVSGHNGDGFNTQSLKLT